MHSHNKTTFTPRINSLAQNNLINVANVANTKILLLHSVYFAVIQDSIIIRTDHILLGLMTNSSTHMVRLVPFLIQTVFVRIKTWLVYGSGSPCDVDSFLTRVSQCTCAVAEWMQSNRLQLNCNKTDFAWLTTNRSLHRLSTVRRSARLQSSRPSHSVTWESSSMPT